MGDDEDFLSRWSRRKRRVVAEDDVRPPTEPAEAAEPEDAPESEEEETRLLESLGLPKPENLGPGDDFRAFMAKEVPQFLRRRALRVLWRSNPVLANLDGLNDYDDDFTSPERNRQVIATAYQIGRGFLPPVRKAENLHDGAENDTSETPENDETDIVSQTPPEDVTLADRGPLISDEEIGAAEEKPFKPKRMSFRD